MSEVFLEIVSAGEINIHLQVLKQNQHQQDMTLEQLQLQLESAQYEANRAFRQFNAVEPENRLVGRSLEKQWNNALKHVEEIKDRVIERKERFQDQLSKVEEKEIRRLVQNLPDIWNAHTTTDKDRKMLLRAAIQEVQLKKIERDVSVKILWIGGAVTDKIVHFHKIRSNISL